jgi:hypothetical protein
MDDRIARRAVQSEPFRARLRRVILPQPRDQFLKREMALGRLQHARIETRYVQ